MNIKYYIAVTEVAVVDVEVNKGKFENNMKDDKKNGHKKHDKKEKDSKKHDTKEKDPKDHDKKEKDHKDHDKEKRTTSELARYIVDTPDNICASATGEEEADL